MNIDIIELGMLDTNCYILSDDQSKHGIIIDPGSTDSKLFEFIKEKKLIIDYILITHGHFDHVGGVKKLLEDLLLMDMSPKVVMNMLEKEDMEEKAHEKYHKKFFQVDVDAKDGELLDFGFVKLKVIMLPGHTNFSVCYYSEEYKMVFDGDTLFYHSIGTEYYYDGPDTDLSDNIVKYLFSLPKDTIVYPGHKMKTTIEEEIVRNPYLSEADTVDPWTL